MATSFACSVGEEPRARRVAPGKGFSGESADDSLNKRILIVEDETLIALDLQAIVLAAGYPLAGVAQDGAQAHRLASEARPSLVIMDIRLARGSDGIEAAKQIFESFGIRSVFLSAHLDAETRARAVVANPHALLSKPIEPNALLQVIARAFGDG